MAFEFFIREPETGRRAVLTPQQFRVIEDDLIAWVNKRPRRIREEEMEKRFLAKLAEMGIPVDFDKQAETGS